MVSTAHLLLLMAMFTGIVVGSGLVLALVLTPFVNRTPPRIPTAVARIRSRPAP